MKVVFAEQNRDARRVVWLDDRASARDHRCWPDRTDPTGDAAPEVLRLIGVGPTDDLAVTFVIESAGKTIYQFELAPLRRGPGVRSAKDRAWEKIRNAAVTIFRFSPGGDAIEAIGWDARAGRFYRLLGCC